MRRSHRAAIGLGVLLSCGTVVLHLDYRRHAGALWRDEVTSVNVATLPSFADVLAHTRFDSFPAAWQTVLHFWVVLGLGETDASLRTLGFLIGMATIGVLWWTGWRLGVGPPLVTLLLFGMSPSTIIYGDSVRGYGLAALAIAWASGAMWAFLERPSRGRFAVAQAAAIFAAQTHYANCVLLAAIGAGAAAVSLRRRNVRLLLAVAMLGAIAALSLLLDLGDLMYITTTAPVGAGDWGLAFLLRVFVNALAPGVPWLTLCWLVAGVLAAIGFVAAWPSGAAIDRDRAVYAGVMLPIAFAGLFYALLQPGVPTNYWHYLSLMAVVALTCEVGIHQLARRYAWGHWARIGGVAAAALLVFRGAADAVPLRMTNLDVAADRIAEMAGPDDLIVVLPWVCGITFERYYRGPAPWITLPDVEDHKVHRHLFIAERMKQGDGAVAPELERVERTLRAGASVWVVGVLTAPDPGHPPARLPPAPHGPLGWSSAPYLESWELQLGALIESHAREGRPVALGNLGRVNAWENLPVVRVAGWR